VLKDLVREGRVLKVKGVLKRGSKREVDVGASTRHKAQGTRNKAQGTSTYIRFEALMEDHIHLVVGDLVTQTHNFLIELHDPALTNGAGT
jgi:hypothetical protein